MTERFPKEVEDLVRSHIREVPDFPVDGVLFRDLTPLIADGDAFRSLINAIAKHYEGKIDAVAGIESRGFILAAPVATALGIGMITIRKAGRIPGPVVGVEYALEYGTARMEIQPFTVREGLRVIIIDDVLATGGTAAAAVKLIEESGARCAGICMLIELSEIDGRAKLPDIETTSVVVY